MWVYFSIVIWYTLWLWRDYNIIHSTRYIAYSKWHIIQSWRYPSHSAVFFSLCKPCCFSHLFVLLNVTRHFTWWNRNSIEKYVPKNLAWNIQPLNKYTNAPSLTDDSRTFILFHSFSIHLSPSLSYFSHSHSQSISIYNDLSDIHAIAILYCDFFLFNQLRAIKMQDKHWLCRCNWYLHRIQSGRISHDASSVRISRFLTFGHTQSIHTHNT